METSYECDPLKNGKPLQYSGHKNSMNYVKRQKVITPKDEPSHPGPKVSNMLLGKSREQLLIVTERIGEGNGTPLQYSCLENPMDGGAW